MGFAELVLLLQITASVALGQAAGSGKPSDLPNEPEALVRSLYTQVVALHPLGSPGPAFDVFAPYLSRALRHRIEVNEACQDDWERLYKNTNSKPPFLEFGLYSGDDLRAEPQAFSIERVQAEKDGSFLVRVRLSRESPPEHPWVWRVAAVVVREGDRLAVDDVIWLRDRPGDADRRLSKVLTEECDGPRWVGLPMSERGQALCRKWLVRVDPRLGKAAVLLPTTPSDMEVFEGIGCLMASRGNRNPARFSGATSPGVSHVLPAATVELAALYYISYLYSGNWRYGDGVALWNRDGVINPPGSIDVAYAAYTAWHEKLAEMGLSAARARHLEPLTGTGLSWYGKPVLGPGQNDKPTAKTGRASERR